MRVSPIMAAAAALALGASLGPAPMQAIESRGPRVPRPAMPRDERKRRERSLRGGHKRRPNFEPLPFVLHQRGADGETPLCRPLATLPVGAHRIADGVIGGGREATCNDCQRAMWAAEQRARAA